MIEIERLKRAMRARFDKTKRSRRDYVRAYKLAATICELVHSEDRCDDECCNYVYSASISRCECGSWFHNDPRQPEMRRGHATPHMVESNYCSRTCEYDAK